MTPSFCFYLLLIRCICLLPDSFTWLYFPAILTTESSYTLARHDDCAQKGFHLRKILSFCSDEHWVLRKSRFDVKLMGEGRALDENFAVKVIKKKLLKTWRFFGQLFDVDFKQHPLEFEHCVLVFYWVMELQLDLEKILPLCPGAVVAMMEDFFVRASATSNS